MTTAVQRATVGEGRAAIPALIARAGKPAYLRFLEFFTVNIRNRNTRAAYARATGDFLRWCEGQGIGELRHVQPVHIAAYVEQLLREMSPPSVKQHLAGHSNAKTTGLYDRRNDDVSVGEMERIGI